MSPVKAAIGIAIVLGCATASWFLVPHAVAAALTVLAIARLGIWFRQLRIESREIETKNKRLG